MNMEERMEYLEKQVSEIQAANTNRDILIMRLLTNATPAQPVKREKVTFASVAKDSLNEVKKIHCKEEDIGRILGNLKAK